MKQRQNKSKNGRPPESQKKPGQNPALSGSPVASLSPRRQWLFRLAALAIVPLLLLGGLELALRLAGYGYATGFFEHYRAGGKDFLVNNESFSLRFFPPQLARWPSPFMFEAQKPANTYRIFILGESAARGEPEPPYAAARYMKVLLEERFPQTRFEVINLGITAIDSHVILPIARDCAKAGGDLWIIYTGNNEMVGPFGAATVFGAKAPPLSFVRLGLAIQKSRLGQLLVDLDGKFQGKNPNATWDGMKMFVGNQLRADDPRKTVVYHNFERNLNDLVRAGVDSGVKILLNTVAVNLKDCPPLASLTNANLTAADRAQFGSLFSAACADEAQTNFAAAAEKFAQAGKLDPLFPELQYRWGECLLAMTNAAAARQHFQSACDMDALPFRADSRINEAIGKTARQFAVNQLVFFDAAAALATEVPSGICGRETFFEHVHFTLDGNFRLGRAWAEQVEKMLPADIAHAAITNGWATQDICERRLGLTDWHRSSVREIVIDRLQNPPLSGQLHNAERIQALRDEAQALRRRMNPTTAAQAAEIYQAAVQRSPQDYWPVENFAEFLEVAGDLKGAAAAWRRECELLPHDGNSFYEYGRLLSACNQWAEAEVALTKSLALHPRSPTAWFAMGGVHFVTGKFATALQDYNRARQLDPQNGSYCAHAGKALSKLSRPAEAIQLYRQAIQLQPDLWVAHFALGDELNAAGQFAEAENEYRLVTQLQPAIAMAHLNRGMMLSRLGQVDEALREFQNTLRLEPGNQQAREYSERVEVWKSHHHQ